jgi:putative AlgH/UPF0301 family transcriptional regulator
MTDDTKNDDGYLAGQLLVAMPQMLDERFAKTVIYMCAHSEDGAMGLVVNKVMENIDFPDLLDQLGLSAPPHGRGHTRPFRRTGGIGTRLCAPFGRLRPGRHDGY